MFAINRQNEILKILKSNHSVTTAELVNRFSVSVETIRRDLCEMEERKLLCRVHGGAIPPDETLPMLDLAERMSANNDKKRELADTAMQFIEENDMISVDVGSTALYFSDALIKNFKFLTVVTYSLDVFEKLTAGSSFEVILCGGLFHKKERFFRGAPALESLTRFHTRKSFLCPVAVSQSGGISDYLCDAYPMQQALMRNADRVYVLADSSKFEKSALLHISDMKKEYTYITDSGLPELMLQHYRESGYTVISSSREDIKQ